MDGSAKVGVATVGAAGLVERVRALEPLIAAHRERFDLERRLPDAVVDALRRAGLLRLWVPAEAGGMALPAADLVEVVEAASALDGSVGWLVANAAAAGRLFGNLPVEVAAALIGAEGSYAVSSTGAVGAAEAVAGGYVISGRWPTLSGIAQAASVAVLCAVERGGAPPLTMMCHLPVGAGRVIDEWHVSGLRGSGSFDFALDRQFVPEERVHRFFENRPISAAPLYRLPLLSSFPLTVGVVPLGLARAALDEFAAIAGARVRAGSALPLAEREWVQHEIGRAEAQRRAAKAAVLAALADLEAALAAGGAALIEARARFRATLTVAAELCLAAVRGIATCAGMAAIRQSGRLERIVRDLDAAVKHVAVAPHNYMSGGRAALGVPQPNERF